jgi:hypothetical protein
MQFQSKSEEDLKRESLLAAGTYDFEVTKAENAISKKAKQAGATESDMIALTLRVFSENGERTIRDWLMPSMGFKLLHFAETTGLLGSYGAGNMTADDCVGRSGRVVLTVKDSAEYGPQNNVKDYEKKKAGDEAAAKEVTAAKAPKLPAAGGAAGDEIPF